MARAMQIVSVGPDVRVQGGISRVIQLITAHLPGHINFRHIPTFTRYTGADGIDRSQRGSTIGQAIVYLRAFLTIIRLGAGRRAVFHVHFADRGSMIRKGILCVALRTLGCTYAVHSHAAAPELFHAWMPRTCRRLLLWGLSGAGQVIVLTRFWADYYASLLDLPMSRIAILPNPADLPESVPDRRAATGLKLLFLGRIGERKGAFDLIRAFSELPDDVRSDCTLTLAGDGEVGAASALAAQSARSAQIVVHGWTDAEGVQSLLRESDAFVLPSHAEGMSMALIEAMSWGLPVIATNAGGAQEFLADGRNSLVVDPGDVNGISKAITDLYRDRQKRMALGRAARETISQFSIGSYIARLSALYEKLARSKTHDRRVTAPISGPNDEQPVHIVNEPPASVTLQ